MNTKYRFAKQLAVILLSLLGMANAHAAVNINYVVNNHLGAPVLLVDENQHVVWQAEYDEFGKATILVEEVEFNVRFPGQYYDKETGLTYNYYRDYDEELGRYVQSDPLGLGGGINTYAYVANNPIMYVDPLGLTVEQASIALGLVKDTQKDLNVPSQAAIAWWYGGKGNALTNPITNNFTVSNYFFKDLNCLEFKLLVDHLIHESIHRTRARLDMIKRPLDHHDIYTEANRRTNELQEKINEMCECDK